MGLFTFRAFLNLFYNLRPRTEPPDRNNFSPVVPLFRCVSMCQAGPNFYNDYSCDGKTFRVSCHAYDHDRYKLRMGNRHRLDTI